MAIAVVKPCMKKRLQSAKELRGKLRRLKSRAKRDEVVAPVATLCGRLTMFTGQCDVARNQAGILFLEHGFLTALLRSSWRHISPLSSGTRGFPREVKGLKRVLKNPDIWEDI